MKISFICNMDLPIACSQNCRDSTEMVDREVILKSYERIQLCLFFTYLFLAVV